MDELKSTIADLVLANRVLDREGVMDAYGHVSVRHPTDPSRFLLSRSRSPALIEEADIVEFNLDGEPVGPEARPLYSERFIHAGVYAARSDVNAVVHSHAEDMLPFGISDVPLRAVIHSASTMGAEIPVWDIRDKFGQTNLLVSNMAQARDLAGGLGQGTVVLMRGHGFVAAGRTLIECLRLAIDAPKNARVLLAALLMGGRVTSLSNGEIDARRFDPQRPDKAKDYDPKGPGLGRAWEYWAHRVRGCQCQCSQNEVRVD